MQIFKISDLIAYLVTISVDTKPTQLFEISNTYLNVMYKKGQCVSSQKMWMPAVLLLTMVLTTDSC